MMIIILNITALKAFANFTGRRRYIETTHFPKESRKVKIFVALREMSFHFHDAVMGDSPVW